MTQAVPDDEQDAALVREMVLLVAGRRDLNRTKLIRDDIDYIWAKPRETRQGHRKRSADAWWSPAAVELRDAKRSVGADGVTVGTTGEHVVPMRVVSEQLLALAEDGRLSDVGEVLRLLRLPIAVVTVAEDRSLRRQDMPPGWSFGAAEAAGADWDRQVWARYDEAGVPVERFRRMDANGRTFGDPPPGYDV